MANIKSAKKRAVQSEKRRVLRSGQRSTVRTSIKAVLSAIESGDKAAAEAAYRTATTIIDRNADREVLHKNTAARHKSRLARRIKAMG